MIHPMIHPMTHPMIYTYDDLGRAFVIADAKTLRRHLKLLTDKHKFPHRMPGHIAKWSKPAVDDWFITQWTRHSSSPARSVGEGGPKGRMRDLLDQHYGSH